MSFQQRVQRAALTLTLVIAALPCASATATGVATPIADWHLDPAVSRTGIVYDRVVALSQLDRFDGSPAAPQATRATWSQMHFELSGAALRAPDWPALDAIRAASRQRNEIPVAILDFAYERLRDPAVAASGRVAASDLVPRRAFAAAPMRETTYRGGACRFAFERAWYATNRGAGVQDLFVDFGDGRGERRVRFGDRPLVHYARTGSHTVRLRAADAGGAAVYASFAIEVAALGTPSPDDTLHVTASIPYGGSAGSGNAYVYLAPGHASAVNPVLVIEGFDIDDSMGWDEIYTILSQENVIETLRGQGFDAVVLDFTRATDPIQRNAFVVTELLEQLQAGLAPNTDMVVVGASMGGLVGRYALAYLEAQATPAQVRTFISFDSPHRGANVPLGVQYWVQFYASLSAEAALQRDLLNAPAARQMLVYHFTQPASATASADPLRTQLLLDFAALGDYPQQPRLGAVANGRADGIGQAFAPGAQIVRYEYDSFLVDLRGNIWAVPNGGPTQIFQGLVDYLFGTDLQSNVSVSGAQPYDNAPGGTRASMADMDAIAAPYGDIVALHGTHCFIPTTSALDFDTNNLFHDIAGDANALAQTPFDAIHYAATNQEHVFIDAATAAWLLAEVQPLPSSTPPPAAAPQVLVLHPNVPNPFNPSTRLRFELPRSGDCEVAVHDVSGRLIATLWKGHRDAGTHELHWDGRTDTGQLAPSGVYLASVRSGDRRASQRMVMLQ